MALPAPPIVERVCAPDATPDVTGVPATVIVVPLSVAVGVSVTDAIEFDTETAYATVAVANTGFNEPELTKSALSFASVLSAVVRVTVTV
jgi:hypothetical protein